MTSEPTSIGTETDAGHGMLAGLGGPPASRTVITGAGLVGLGTVAGARLLGIVHNAPFDPLAVPAGVLSATTVGVSLVLAFSLIAVALASDPAPVRVGLLFAGVFGTLALFSPAATLPTATALTGGAAVALLGTTGVPATYREVRRAVIAVGVVAALAVSLGSSLGLLDGGLQGLGGMLTLGAVTAVVVRAGGDRVALLAGTLAGAAVVGASATSPFVLGSTLLVGFAVAGVPHVVAALAVGAGVSVAVAGLRRGDRSLAAGAGLLVLAGVPVAFPRAMALVLGATLVLVDVETLAGLDAAAGREGTT